MGNVDQRLKNEIQFNYWIYILTCLLITAIPVYITSKDSITGKRNIYIIVLQLALTFIFSSAAWIVGKKRDLNYIWICALGVTGNVLLKFLGLVFNVLISGGYDKEDLDFLGFVTFAFIGVILIFTFLILVISYPLQLLLLKTRNNLN